MNISKDITQQLQAKKYLSHLPDFKEEKTQEYTSIILTLIALIIFVFFAIAPTLSTITQRQKQVEDSRLVNEKLEAKLSNLQKLQEQYEKTIKTDLPTILAAIPITPLGAEFIGQIETIAVGTNVQPNGIHIKNIELAKNKSYKTTPGQTPLTNTKDYYSWYDYGTLTTGRLENTHTFISQLSQFERITIIDSISLRKEIAQQQAQQVENLFTASDPNERVELTVEGKSYFMK